MSKTEKLLRELIALPSVNPAFLPAQSPGLCEQQVAEFLAVRAAQERLDFEFQRVLPGRSNLLVRLTPSGRVQRRILLTAHMDTVNATPEQFTPRKAGSRIFGRGACDTKGSVAAMFRAICAFGHNGRRPKNTELIFAGVVDEENGQAGSRALIASGFAADLAIVGEATRLQVVTAHKGSLWLRLETQGRSAHGAQPELGRNAVHAMAKVVDFLETGYAAALRKRRHPVLGSPTVNVGTICGGAQPNIVPDKCEVRIDRRTLPGETPAGVQKEILSLLRQKGLRATITADKLAPCLSLETDSRLPLVAQFLRSAGQRRPAGVNYFCDASVLAQGGIPSVVFGPGDIAQAHTANEWISVTSLERAEAMLVRFLSSIP
jgi:acetylornithine deacetylase/succinyl-diaminopimelate desuccinylase-like protein